MLPVAPKSRHRRQYLETQPCAGNPLPGSQRLPMAAFTANRPWMCFRVPTCLRSAIFVQKTTRQERDHVRTRVPIRTVWRTVLALKLISGRFSRPGAIVQQLRPLLRLSPSLRFSLSGNSRTNHIVPGRMNGSSKERLRGLASVRWTDSCRMRVTAPTRPDGAGIHGCGSGRPGCRSGC